MRSSILASRVQGIIDDAGADVEAKHLAYLHKNRKVITRIRQRLEEEEKNKFEKKAVVVKGKLKNYGKGNSVPPKLHYPDPTRPNKKNKADLVKYA